MKKLVLPLIAIFPLILITMLFARPASASYGTPLPIEELVKKADYIVIGTFDSKESYYEEGLIYTRFHLSVEKVIKGNTNKKEMMIISLGGVIGDQSLYITDGVSINLSTKVIAFLNRYKENEDRFYFKYSDQGIYYLDTKWQDWKEGEIEKFINFIAKTMTNNNIPISLTEEETLVALNNPELILKKLFPGISLNMQFKGTGLLSPQITEISPNPTWAGPLSYVKIKGQGFGLSKGNGSVLFTQDPLTQPPSWIEPEINTYTWTDSEIVVNVPIKLREQPLKPISACSGTVKVTTDTGDSCTYNNFQVLFSYIGQKWGSENPPGETFQLNANAPDCQGEEIAVGNAAGVWNVVDNIHFHFEPGPASEVTQLLPPNNQNDIFWGLTLNEAAAAESYVYYEGNIIYEADTCFNSRDAWSAEAGPVQGKYDVWSVAAHEFGHWLYLMDLRGVADFFKTMFGGDWPGNIEKRDLEPEDMAGIRQIYPSTAYRLSINNQDNDKLIVEFKADTDAVNQIIPVPSGNTAKCRVGGAQRLSRDCSRGNPPQNIASTILSL